MLIDKYIYIGSSACDVKKEIVEFKSLEEYVKMVSQGKKLFLCGRRRLYLCASSQGSPRGTSGIVLLTIAIDHGQCAAKKLPIPLARSLFVRRAKACTEKSPSCPNGTSRKQKIPKRIGAEFIDHLVRIDDIAATLRHFFSIDGPPAVGEDRFRKWQVQGHQHRGPIDGMGRENVLADEMDVGRPELILNDGFCGRYSRRRHNSPARRTRHRSRSLVSNGSSIPHERRDFGREIDRSPSFWVVRNPRTSLRRDSGRMKLGCSLMCSIRRS